MFFDTVQGPYPCAYGLTQCGELKCRTSGEIKQNDFSVGLETLDRELFDPEPCYGKLSECGIKWARIQSGWSRTEKSPGCYDFDWQDRVVDQLSSHGIRPWMSLSFGNVLYSPEAKHISAVGCPPVCGGPEAAAGWERFIAAVVRRYRKRIRCFEIWNEPDNPLFWGPGKPDPKEYVELARITSAVIRREAPEAEIIGGAFSGWGDFVTKCLEYGLGDFCDILSFHTYGMLPEYAFCAKVKALKARIRKYAPHLQLWHGESGCPSESREHFDEWLKLYHCDREVQAKWLARAIATTFRAGLRFFSYYHASDLTCKPYIDGRGIPTKVGRCGLLHAPGAVPKPSWHVMKHFCSLFDSELEFDAFHFQIGYENVNDPVLDSDQEFYGNILADCFTRRNYPLYLYYYPGDLQRKQVLRSAVGNTFTAVSDQGAAISKPVLADPCTGRIFRFQEFQIKSGMLLLRSLPVTDYPLILTDLNALDYLQ